MYVTARSGLPHFRQALAEGQQPTDAEALAGLLGPKAAPRIAAALESHGSIAGLARLGTTGVARLLGRTAADRFAVAIAIGRRSLAPPDRKASITCAGDVYAFMLPRIGGLAREEFHVLLLDARHRLIAQRRVAEGGLASCAVSPRDVFEAAIRESAPAMVLCHNHPSGDPSPSADDVALTRRLTRAAEAMGIVILDHVVVATGGYSSLAEMGSW